MFQKLCYLFFVVAYATSFPFPQKLATGREKRQRHFSPEGLWWIVLKSKCRWRRTINYIYIYTHTCYAIGNHIQRMYIYINVVVSHWNVNVPFWKIQNKKKLEIVVDVKCTYRQSEIVVYPWKVKFSNCIPRDTDDRLLTSVNCVAMETWIYYRCFYVVCKYYYYFIIRKSGTLVNS